MSTKGEPPAKLWGTIKVPPYSAIWVAKEQNNDILVYMYKDILKYVCSKKVKTWAEVPGAIDDLATMLTGALEY